MDADGWQHEEHALTREFEFEDFKQALDFINTIGALAEAHGHHPEIWNVYNQVRLRLSTHDAGDTVTEKDIELAAAINGLL